MDKPAWLVLGAVTVLYVVIQAAVRILWERWERRREVRNLNALSQQAATMRTEIDRRG